MVRLPIHAEAEDIEAQCRVALEKTRDEVVCPGLTPTIGAPEVAEHHQGGLQNSSITTGVDDWIADRLGTVRNESVFEQHAPVRRPEEPV